MLVKGRRAIRARFTPLDACAARLSRLYMLIICRHFYAQSDARHYAMPAFRAVFAGAFCFAAYAAAPIAMLARRCLRRRCAMPLPPC